MFGKKKILFYVVLIVALASLLVACGGAAATEAPAADAPAANAVATDVPAADAAATEVPAADAPTAVADAPTAAASSDVVPQFVFTNTGAAELCNLYLSPVGVDSWGPDQLGGLTIKPGEKFTLKNIPAATYDVKVVGCNNAGEQVIKLDIKN
jgi:hypothetical protein